MKFKEEFMQNLKHKEKDIKNIMSIFFLVKERGGKA